MTSKRENYLSWNECFMQIAYVISQRSKDPSTQAGAVIVNSGNIIIGLGYNGFPRNCDDDKLPWSREGDFLNSKYAYVVHAEENAIYNSNNNTNNCKLYCTLFPCNECAKTIIQSGITEIIFSSDKYHDQKPWIAARKMFDLAAITYRQYSPEYTLRLEKKSPEHR